MLHLYGINLSLLSYSINFSLANCATCGDQKAKVQPLDAQPNTWMGCISLASEQHTTMQGCLFVHFVIVSKSYEFKCIKPDIIKSTMSLGCLKIHTHTVPSHTHSRKNLINFEVV